MNAFKNLWSFFNKQDKIFFFIIILMSIIQALLEMIGIVIIIPFITFLLKPEELMKYDFLNNYINLDSINFQSDFLLIFCIVFFLIFLIKNFFIVFSTKLVFKFIYNFRNNLYLKLLKNILHQNYNFYMENNTSKISNILNTQIDTYTLYVLRPIIFFVSELIIFLGIFLLIILGGFFDSLLFMIPILLFSILILKRINRSIKSWSIIRINENQKLINSSFNLINSIKEIILYGKIADLIKKFKQPVKLLSDIEIKNSIINIYPKILLEQSLILILIIIMLSMSFAGKINDEIIITLGFYLAAAYRVLPSINKIFNSIQHLKFGKPSYGNIKEYFDLDYKIKFFENSQNNFFYFIDKIEIKNLNFEYVKNKKVLNNINFKIEKNKIVGILGNSGSGKTTLINLLAQLLNLQSGKITIDGKIIESTNDKRKFQNLISITSQDSFLFDGTIKDNIIFGSDKKFSNQDFYKSIEMAQLEDVIKKLPSGINENIGSEIKTLSSGQKQRITIARSFYNKRQLMIFDEATNSLDNQNEKKIIENLKSYSKNSSIIIISHNLDNLKICDHIYKLNEGNLSELNLKI
jgi:ATP-binding cassette subfamily C protein